MSEFDLIATYFTWDDSVQGSVQGLSKSKTPQNKLSPSNSSHVITNNVIKGVGDDAAVLSLAPNQQLVTSIDTLVSGVHFPVNTSAFDIGHKSLAVNLSDLAAMGAKPEWFTLALTLPETNHDWLSEFSRGLKTLAQEAGITLVGGDTTSGPLLVISIQVMGSVEKGKALYRNGAKQGDKIYVTGTLGDGAAGLAWFKDELTLAKDHADYCTQRLNRPTPRLNESELVKTFASACIDVSDGFLQDLSHILKQSTGVNNVDNEESELGATLDLSQIPFSDALKSIGLEKALSFALKGGDDYEILFTLPEAKEADFLTSIKDSNHLFTCIGSISNKKGVVDINNNPLMTTGYNHFHE